MKKLYSLSFILMLSITMSYAQTTLFTDNFESYTAGLRLIQQAPGTDWVTFSNIPGFGDDPYVSNTSAISGANSVQISAGKNLVLQLHDKITGRFMIKTFARVTPDRTGFFSILQDFDSYNSIYGMEIYFIENGPGTLNAGGTNSGEFTYIAGDWIPIKVIIDLDDDFATLYINDNEVVSWIWSTGSAGCNSLAKLDAINFYGMSSATAMAETYYDDVEIIELLPLAGGPSNLTSTANGSGINLSWNAPSTGTPDHYAILRNGVVINSSLTTTSFSDENLYPNTYINEVKSHYSGLGYSPSSNISISIY